MKQKLTIILLNIFFIYGNLWSQSNTSNVKERTIIKTVNRTSSENINIFQKQTRPEIKLIVADESTNRYAQIYYLENATTGFDNGYDGELYGASQNSFEIYSHLLSDNQNKKYQIQSLPDSNYESMIIPIGLKVAADKQITFFTETLNLPTGYKVFLEDKITNTFSRLDEINSEYQITITEALDGVGRFYIHTSQNSLSVSNETLNTINIYQPNNSTLRIIGLSEGNTNLKLFNILGEQVINSSFIANGVKDISLPNLAKGFYLIQLETETSKFNKKIILE